MKSGSPRSWYNPTSIIRSFVIRTRVWGAIIAAAIALFLLPHDLARTVRGVIAWDIGGIVYLLFAFQLILTCGADRIKGRAAQRDDSRLVILTIILLAIASSFTAIAGLINEAKLGTTPPETKVLLAVLAIFTIVISWTVTQVAFAIHYAHAYYRPEHGNDSGYGLQFPGCDTPDYWDFLYFSTSIGASSQTSDTAVKSRAMRRLVTMHAVVAFFFNTAVVALTVNIAAGLAG